MKAEKIDHVAIRVREAKKAIEFFSGLFNTEFSKLNEVKEADIRIFVDPIGIEIIEPLTPDGPTSKAIEKRGEGLAVLALKVVNLEEAIAEMKSKGIRMIGKQVESNFKAAQFHPADTYGAMIELIERKSQP